MFATNVSNGAARRAKSLILSLIYRTRFCGWKKALLLTMILVASASTSGCASWNENPRNDRFWFPTLFPASSEEKASREKTFPEGGDPYVDATVGPSSVSARPNGRSLQRSNTSTVFGVLPDVDEND